MVFSSLTFLLAFLPIVLFIYYLVPMRAKNIVLTIGSLVFYAWGEPVYIILMIYSILLNYRFGKLIDKSEKNRKSLFIFTLIINVFILFFFKYYGFVVSVINQLFNINLVVREIPLPIGISFYTFQALSYIIDIYRKKFKPQNNLITFAAYITMFPQLIAGPIVRYEDLQEELVTRKLSLERLGYGCSRFLYGLCKKVIIANSIGALYDSAQLMGNSASVLTGWIGAVSFTFQIYFDFSGYSDMAIGLGHMLGFSFNENFNEPYKAESITDFWRRWHISLGSWFREYVYIPLGGNRTGVAKHIRNIMIVWMLTGMWHGAGWNFIIWGLYYGILLILDKYVLDKIKYFPKFIRRIITIIEIIVGWVIFSSDSVAKILTNLKIMFGFGGLGFVDINAVCLLRTNLVLLLVCLLLCMGCAKKLYKFIENKKIAMILIPAVNTFLFLLCCMFLVTQSYNPFLYFQF